MEEPDGYIEHTDVPDEFKAVGQSINRFVDINYETARSMIARNKITPADIAQYKGQLLDIIRNNPPLASIPEYFRDGREDYLWYSDFYDEITKDVYHKYRTFTVPQNEITTANYAEELAKIDLPYFKELVNLISLERLLMDYPNKELEVGKKSIVSQTENELPSKQAVPKKPKDTSKAKPKTKKRSYEPKLTDAQYKLLTKCIEDINLFRRPVKITELKKLLTGKLKEPLQVTNQKSLVYLFDQLSEYKYIKETWVSVADGNKDFISFRSEGNKRRYGNEVHYIPMQQMLNDRKRNYKEAVRGLIEIEEMIELMEENRED